VAPETCLWEGERALSRRYQTIFNIVICFFCNLVFKSIDIQFFRNMTWEGYGRRATLGTLMGINLRFQDNQFYYLMIYVSSLHQNIFFYIRESIVCIFLLGVKRFMMTNYIIFNLISNRIKKTILYGLNFIYSYVL